MSYEGGWHGYWSILDYSNKAILLAGQRKFLSDVASGAAKLESYYLQQYPAIVSLPDLFAFTNIVGGSEFNMGNRFGYQQTLDTQESGAARRVAFAGATRGVWFN